MFVSFDFAFDRRFRPLLALGGIRPATCEVVVTDRLLDVRFGPFRLQTPRENVRDVCVTGPYLPIKAIGPRGSRMDGGVTFGTNADGGVCVGFHEPVGALFGRNRLRHPGMTVTVADIDGLVDALTP
jgi:hypothetical protein